MLVTGKDALSTVRSVVEGVAYARLKLGLHRLKSPVHLLTIAICQQ